MYKALKEKYIHSKKLLAPTYVDLKIIFIKPQIVI